MKQTFLMMLALVLAIGLRAQAGFSLQEAVDYGLKNSLSIRNSLLGVEDARQQIIETRAIGLPQVNASVNYQYFVELPVSLIPANFFDPNAGPDDFAEVTFGTSNNLAAQVEMSTLLFDGSYLVALKASRMYTEYVQHELRQKEYEVGYNIMSAYLPALILQENVALIDSNIVNLEAVLRETRAFFQEGFVELLDVERLELSLANLQTERESLLRQYDMALNGLKFQMGYPVGEALVLKDNIESLLKDATAADLEAEVDYEARPEYRVIDMGIQLNEENIRATRAGYFPSLAGFASFQRTLQSNDLFSDNGFWLPTSVVGVQLNVPIFDGLQRSAKIQRNKIEVEKLRNQQLEFERAVALEVQNARIAYRNAKEKVVNRRRNLELAERIYNTTQVKYKEGVGSSLEVTSAEGDLYQAQANYTAALYDLLQAKLGLDKALGRPVK